MPALSRRVLSYVNISVDEYNREIEKYFGESPELINLLRQQEGMYSRLGGREFCISTGNVLFRYRENPDKKQVYVVGLIAKKGRMVPSDLRDVLSIVDDFFEKLKDGWTILASVNSNSRKLIEHIKRKARHQGIPIKEVSHGEMGFLNRPEFTFETIELKKEANANTIGAAMQSSDLVSEVFSELQSRYFFQLIRPKISFVDNLGCMGKTVYNPETAAVRVELNSKVKNSKKLLRQILAHELIHVYLYQKYGEALDQHGEHFKFMADRINLSEGDSYVTVFADDMCFASTLRNNIIYALAKIMEG